EGLVDQVAKQRPVEVPAPRRLREQDREQRLPGIDPEGRAGDAAPGVLAGRAGRVTDAIDQAYRVAEAETVTRRKQVADARDRPEVIGDHPLAGLAPEQAHIARPAAALHHL